MDTNVLWSALWSAYGASREVLYLIDEGGLTPVVSVPIFAEYESALKRAEFLSGTSLSRRDVDSILDYLLSRCGDPHAARIPFEGWRLSMAKRTTIRLVPPLQDALSALSEELGVSYNQLVNYALTRFVESQKNLAVLEARARDRAHGLCAPCKRPIASGTNLLLETRSRRATTERPCSRD